MEHGAIREFLNMSAAATHFLSMLLSFVLGPFILLWITFATNYWYIPIAYLIWIWVIDAHTPEKGGRSCNWIRGSKLFQYARDYYPVTVKAVPGFKLDPQRNYMFCCFPHAIIPHGGAIALGSKACGVDNLIPNHTFHPLTLNMVFKVPLMREYFLSFGACSVSVNSINWLLNHPNGGKIAAIIVGGAAEALLSDPGVYKIVLKNRKGFVKLALKNGSPLVPVFTFGEVDTFRQFEHPEGSLLWRFQVWCKAITGIPPLIFTGRGYFQRYIGLIPQKKPINVVIGKPIDVQRNTNPSQEEIDNLHQTFITQLNQLFEEYKYTFIENPEETMLTIV